MSYEDTLKEELKLQKRLKYGLILVVIADLIMAYANNDIIVLMITIIPLAVIWKIQKRIKEIEDE